VGNLLVGIMQHENTCKGKFKKYSNVVSLNSVNQPALLKLNDGFVAQRKPNGLWYSCQSVNIAGVGFLVLVLPAHLRQLMHAWHMR
jgi:hypothetical protein